MYDRCQMKKQWIRAAIVLGVVLSIALVKTNPTAEQHYRALHPGSSGIGGLRSEPLGRQIHPNAEAAAEIAERPPFELPAGWNDYKIFSTTTDVLSGARRSFGILNHVFDLRSAELRESEQLEAGREEQERLFKAIENAAEPQFPAVETNPSSGEIDYSPRGCEISGTSP
jgi:hypothetical protein